MSAAAPENGTTRVVRESPATRSVAAELVEDRHIEKAEQDRLGHTQVAKELADLVEAVPMPSNIALYGPWGSGKSGMAHLLREELRSRKSASKLVVFDAFKYAETPLRRHFIAEVAHRLEISDHRFQAGLYAETTDTDVQIPPNKVRRLLRVFVVTVLLGALVAALVALGIAAVADGPTGGNFTKFVAWALPLGTLPASVLLAFIAFAGKTFTVNRTVSAPSGDEQFERLFEALVRKSGTSRLIVFVDELDRCSSEEVVTTLETIRTFLGIKGCVFVVAADQQVLERALREKVRQATPANSRNPYYSSGSEYLDKTFHHHLHLPPLLPRRLTRFAADTVAANGGLWGTLDLDEVMPVLIPTHVRSPRRVKVLLNNFVATFRLAERKVEAGVLDTDLDARAAEIAKLVALRCEFPLFAADLAVDARLPKYVLTARRGDELPEHLSDGLKRLAQRYADGLLPVDQLLIAEPPVMDGNANHLAAESDLEAIQVDELEPVTRSPVHVAQAAQLLAFLEKSEHIEGPRRDLIYLESTGHLFGLDSSFADRLEEFAVNGQRRAVIAALRELEDDGARVDALRLLAQVTRDSDLHGVEARNCMSSLLGAVSGLPDLDLAVAAGELAQTVGAHVRSYDLMSADLPGAFLVAVGTPLESGDELIQDWTSPVFVDSRGLAVPGQFWLLLERVSFSYWVGESIPSVECRRRGL